MLSPDGNFYGTTAGGGGGNCWIGCGTIFRITPGGTFTTLYTFSGSDGSNPYAGLLLGTDGNLYGVTSSGGTQQGYGGTVFKITPSGALTTLYIFCSQNLPCSDGAYPVGTLVQGADGNFYGTTEVGGDPECPIDEVGCGTTFKITPTGTLTTLHVFNGNDGADLLAGLALGYDGNFYGAAAQGGAFCNSLGQPGCGTVFRMTPAGTLTVLHNFNGSDGSYPAGALLVADDGNLSGTTAGGGSGYGTVFSLSSTTISYDLDVSTGGTGTVTSTDGFINCPGVHTSVFSRHSCHDECQSCAGMEFHFVEWRLQRQWKLQRHDEPVAIRAGCVCPGRLQPDCFDERPGQHHQYRRLHQLSRHVQSHVFLADAGNVERSSGARLELLGLERRLHRRRPVQSQHERELRRQRLLLSAWQRIAVCPDHALSPARHAFERRPDSGGKLSDLQSACFGADKRLRQSLVGGRLLAQRHPGAAERTRFLSHDLARRAGAACDLDDELRRTREGECGDCPRRRERGSRRYVANTTNLLLDIDGYFTAPSSSTLKFYPVTPCRLADTRSSDYPPGLGTPNLAGGVARDFPVLSSSCIPSGVTPAAYSLNLTAIPYPQGGDRLGYLEGGGGGGERVRQPQNPVSTLNNPTGTNVANAAIVPAGTGGSITAFPSDDTNLAIDINGYFASSGTGGLSLYPAPPCRVFDSRGVGNGQPFSGTLSPPINVAGSVCAPPSGALGYVFNATVVPSPTLSYLTLWPDSEGQPTVSTLNAAMDRSPRTWPSSLTATERSTPTRRARHN